MQQLVKQYGSQAQVVQATYGALIEALAQQGELAGKYDEVLVVGGVKIQVSGIIIDGVVRIGTAYVVKE